MAVILKAQVVAKQILDQLKAKLKHNFQCQPTLVIFSTNNTISIYVKNLIKLCEQFLIKVILKTFSPDNEKNLLREIKRANRDDSIDCIIVELPLDKKINKNLVLSQIDVNKDLDCLNYINQGKILINDYQIMPAVCEAILMLLDYYQIDLLHKNITVIGRSSHLSLLLAILLTYKQATVTICHQNTVELTKILLNSDIIINASGVTNLVPISSVRSHHVVISLNDNDTNFSQLLNVVKALAGKPFGVGVLTLAILVNNIYKIH